MKDKKYFNIKTGLLIFLFITGLWACNENEQPVIGDDIPPGAVTNVSFKQDHGGGVFYYDIPNDEDILMVKAVYTLDAGEEIFKSSSFYADSVRIAGLGTEKEYSVKLIAVDRSGNESVPHIEKVTPLEPFTSYVMSTIDVIPSFSSIYVKWKNQLEENLTIMVTFNEEGYELTKSYSSNRSEDNLSVDGLTKDSYSFSVVVKDDYGNKTEVKQFDNVIPMHDYKLSKEEWSWLNDELLPDEMNEEWTELNEETGEMDILSRTLTMGEKGGHNGGWNAKEWEYEGHILKLWDDIIDDGALRNMNFCASGNGDGLPQSYYIDLGRQVRVSRVAIWQRDWDYRINAPGFYYQSTNVEEFEIWISNDKVNWKKVRYAKIVKPSDPIVARSEGLKGHHFVLYPDNPKFTEEFRYLEFRAMKTFGNVSFFNCSELTVYGEEVD